MVLFILVMRFSFWQEFEPGSIAISRFSQRPSFESIPPGCDTCCQNKTIMISSIQICNMCLLSKENDHNYDMISKCEYVWGSVRGTSHLVSGARAIFSSGKTTWRLNKQAQLSESFIIICMKCFESDCNSKFQLIFSSQHRENFYVVRNSLIYGVKSWSF